MKKCKYCGKTILENPDEIETAERICEGHTLGDLTLLQYLRFIFKELKSK